MTILTPMQASEIAGVPAAQLIRWAYLGQGPRNSGTKHKPAYHEDEVREWRHRHDEVLLRAVEEATR